jgi:hypothetical protein
VTTGPALGAVKPLGAPRLIEALRLRGFSPGRGVALYATPGDTALVIRAENPMLPTPRRRIAAIQARAAAAGIPPIIALVVDADRVTMYPASTRGDAVGDPVEVWHAGEFWADSRANLFVRRLYVSLKDGQRIEAETKTTPVGPNRFHARVTAMIVDMGRHGWAARVRK